MRPCSASSAGRTNTSNDTAALTGFPGRPNSSIPPSVTPKPCGLPGCIATLVNSMTPASEFLTGSYAPALTPPEKTTTSAPSADAAATASAGPSPSSGTVSRSTTSHPASVDQSGEQLAVGLRDLAAVERFARRHELGAGRDHGDAGSA